MENEDFPQRETRVVRERAYICLRRERETERQK
jgi:hypothetical protein